MATVTGYTAERMLEIENSTVIDGEIVGDNLILETRGGTEIDAGSVRGEQGIQGIPGPPGTAGEKVTTGVIADFPKLPLPAGWLECNGAIRTIVAEEEDLAEYLGTTFGGNGTTTYGLPAYNGLVRVARDAGQTEFDTVGEVGGEKAHVLTIAELALHTHPDNLAAPAHTHPIAHVHDAPGGGYLYSAFATGYQIVAGSGGLLAAFTANPSNPNSGAASSTTLSGGIQNAGSSAAHNNLQPYKVVITAIKL